VAQFINCKKSVEIVDGKNKACFPAGYIGRVPEWAEQHWYYKALCKDGTITAVVRANEKTPEELAAEEVARTAAAEKKALNKRLVDEAKATAKEEAEKKAAEDGLNATDTKKLVAEMVKAAVDAVSVELVVSDTEAPE